MKKYICMLLMMAAMSANAQLSAILGEWKTVDDKTGDSFSIISIYQGKDGLFHGKIAKMLVGEPGLRCEACRDEDRNALLEGLVIIRGMSFNKEKNQLEGGKVLEPETGKFYYGKIYPKDGKLVLRGSLDKRGIFGRSQTWIRK